MTGTASVLAALEDAECWFHVFGENGQRCYAMANIPGYTPNAVFTREELDHVDVRLSQVIDATTVMRNTLDQSDRHYYSPPANGYLVRNTLRYWNCALIELPPEAHMKLQELQPLRHIFFKESDPPEFSGKHLTIRYWESLVKKTATGVEYVDRDMYRTSEVRYDWLDKVYPGWRDRYSLAIDLGFNTRDVMYHLFTDAPAQRCEVALPETSLAIDN